MSLDVIENLNQFADASRPANSGVRFSESDLALKCDANMTREGPLYRLITLCVVWMLFPLGLRPATAQQRRESKVPEQVVRLLLRDEGIRDVLGFKHEYTIEGLAKRLTAEPTDLNRYGKPEIIVHGINDICGAQNCYYWIFRRAGKGYRLLLDAGFIQYVKPQKTLSNGYRDVMGAMHGSAWAHDLTLYKFDGRRYRRAGCFSETYRRRDKSGGFREVRRPIITRRKCNAEQ
jgi:hypothetical protein